MIPPKIRPKQRAKTTSRPPNGRPPKAAAAEGEAARVLSQNEIDSLLGFERHAAAGGQENSGIMALINSALVNYERLPMLEVVFDRLVRMMSTSLAQFHLRQRRSQPRPDHLGAFRRLSEFHSAARHADASSKPRNGTIRA